MSQRDDAVPMRHMLGHAREALALVADRQRLDFPPLVAALEEALAQTE